MEWWRAASDSKVDEEEAWLPPGFRFHPTDEELVTFYLRRKVQNGNFTDRAIAEVDFNKVEPWDLPERAKTGEKEWYFFSLLDRKYPTGMRTNRATDAGYWKATGKDREITCSRTSLLLGMKKTLVFYKGRAPKGEKTNWVIHEYRLECSNIREFQRVCKEEWVVCRVFKKSVPTALKSITALEINRQPSYELDSSLPALESPHMAHLPSSSPSAHQQETPLFHNHCYNQTNKSFGVSNRDSIALGSSLTCLPLPNSSFTISSTPAPFCSLQQEAGPGFNKNKSNDPFPFLFPSLSSHYNLPNQQQYSYPPGDCKIETLQQTCVNSEFTATQGNMFGRNAMNAQSPGKEATCTIPLFNEAVAIPLDPIPTGPCKPHSIPDAIPLDPMSTGTCLSHAIPVSISIESMSNGTCMSHVIPPEFDSLWAF